MEQYFQKTVNGFVILIDFGISIFISDEGRFPWSCTPIFASENQRGAKAGLSHADDVFSVCSTVYALEYGLEEYTNKYDKALPLKTMLERSPVVSEIYRYATRHWCCLNFFDQFPKELSKLPGNEPDFVFVPSPSFACTIPRSS